MRSKPTELTLLTAAKAGDVVSRDMLAERFYGLVEKIIAKRNPSVADLDEMRAAGRSAVFEGLDVVTLPPKSPLGIFLGRHIEKALRKSRGEPVDRRGRPRRTVVGAVFEGRHMGEHPLGQLLRELKVQDRNPSLDSTAWLEAVEGMQQARYREVLKLRYGLVSGGPPRKLREIAVVLGVSLQRAQQLHARALRSLIRIGEQRNLFAPHSSDTG